MILWYHIEKRKEEFHGEKIPFRLHPLHDGYRAVSVHSNLFRRWQRKNTFVDALAKGYEESQPDGRMETLEPKRVLCITSRRAKVDELKNAEDVAYGTQVLEYESLDYVEDLDSYFASKRELSCNGIWGTIPIYQRSIACTNAAIERYLEKHYRADKAEDFLWNRFDIIVVDEAHAVVADASYQTAPYYVHSLIDNHLFYLSNRIILQGELYGYIFMIQGERAFDPLCYSVLPLITQITTDLIKLSGIPSALGAH